jgi:hypothetical protein
LFANETTSLCLENPAALMRTFFQTLAGSPPALIALATDGYANSFRTAQDFRRVGPDVLTLLRRDGVEAVQENLSGWLAEAAQTSGDDVTLAIIAREAALDTTPSSAEDDASCVA